MELENAVCRSWARNSENPDVGAEFGAPEWRGHAGAAPPSLGQQEQTTPGSARSSRGGVRTWAVEAPAVREGSETEMGVDRSPEFNYGLQVRENISGSPKFRSKVRDFRSSEGAPKRSTGPPEVCAGIECSALSVNQQIVGEEACGIPDVTDMEMVERSDMEVGREFPSEEGRQRSETHKNAEFRGEVRGFLVFAGRSSDGKIRSLMVGVFRAYMEVRTEFRGRVGSERGGNAGGKWRECEKWKEK